MTIYKTKDIRECEKLQKEGAVVKAILKQKDGSLEYELIIQDKPSSSVADNSAVKKK